MENKTIDLFLCHSGADKEFVSQLAERIEKEQLDGRNLRVFLDVWDIQPGANIVHKLNEGLSKAKHIAIIMSPEMISADWCMLEASSFLIDDPINRKGRIVPVVLREKHLTDSNVRLEIPPVLRALNYMDFRTPKSYEKDYHRLVNTITGVEVPRTAISSTHRSHLVNPQTLDLRPNNSVAKPDPISEVLISNLLPVKIPDYVWVAQTMLYGKKDLFEFYKYPAFTVRSDLIYTFIDLSQPNNDFADVVKPGTKIEKIRTASWLNDKAKWRIMVELLNDTLRRYLWRSGVGFNNKGQRYFFKANKDQSTYLQWGSGTKRSVVKRPEDGVGNWIHQAARLHFEKFEDTVFLSIEPSYMYTFDGETPLNKEEATPLNAKWGGRERNGTIVRHMLMWCDVLTNGSPSIKIPIGSQVLQIDRLPSTASTTVGIADDKTALGALLQFTDEELSLSSKIYGFVEDPNSSAEPTPEVPHGT